MVKGITVCTIDRTYSIAELPEGPEKETAGWFGFCQRFDTEEDREKFIDFIKTQGYIEEDPAEA